MQSSDIRKDTSYFDIIILGAGCAWMTLACRLAQSGYTGRVLIADRRLDFTREQRWCCWGPIDIPIPDAVTRSWLAFTVVGKGVTRKMTTRSAPYLHIESKLYLESIQGILEKTANFTLELGCAINSVERDANAELWRCETPNHRFGAPLIFDGRNNESEIGAADGDGPWLWQSFAGMVVQSEAALFDKDCVTLMDFDVEDGDRGAFIYVLPFSNTTALIESTSISRDPLAEAEHQRKVRKYVAERIGAAVKEISVEFGNIPMTTYRMPFERGDGRFAIGISGGAAKPSTGYAFARIQEQCASITEALMAGCTPTLGSESWESRRRQWLDDVFIIASYKNEQFFTETTLTMVRKLPSDLLVRFLAERSTVSDDLRVMAAVGSPELLSAAAQVAARKR